MKIEELKIGDEVFVKGVISDVSFGIHGNKKFDVRTTPFEDIKGFVTKDRLMLPNQPEVPQMIFDVIKTFDDDVDYLHHHMSRQSDEVREWLTHNEREFYEAWLAYPNITIEKEKLYTVEIPNPNSDLKIILVKVNKKLKLIEAYEDQLEEYKNIRNVTESEIRKDFDWAWQFRKDVENE
ncbi:TPA: DUF1642 domain-containing protein [Streptococcus agalactiae]